MDKTCLFVICAAPLARRAVDVATVLVDQGWTVVPVATPSAADGWADVEGLERVTGSPVVWRFGQAEQPVDPRGVDVVAVCPATFNTINKLSAGIADNYPLSLMSEALGRGTPMLLVPFVNESLWSHPRLAQSLNELGDCGARFLDIDGNPGAAPVAHGSGDLVSRSFAPARLAAALR